MVNMANASLYGNSIEKKQEEKGCMQNMEKDGNAIELYGMPR